MSLRAPPVLPALEPGLLIEWQGVHGLVLPLAADLSDVPKISWNARHVDRPHPLSTAAAPGDSLRQAPPWLGRREAAIYRAFPYEPRAHEWLAGRRTAKALLRAVYDLLPEEVEILPEPTDAPRVDVDGVPRPTLRLSLSHTATYAAAVVSAEPVGVDLCDLEDGRRIRRIASRVFSEGEAEDTGALDSDARGALVWALKEAGLKVDIGGVFSPGARAIRVRSLDPVTLGNPDLDAAAWWLPRGALAIARRSS